jgi:hypothetical protein
MYGMPQDRFMEVCSFSCLRGSFLASFEETYPTYFMQHSRMLIVAALTNVPFWERRMAVDVEIGFSDIAPLRGAPNNWI